MKKNNYKLTVILGTFNRLPLLKRCLIGLLGKIKSSHQIIVVDAGSTDRTYEFLNRNRNKLKVVNQKNRIGQAKTLNKILKKISSEYVCWLSDDNVVKPKMLDLAVSILDKEKDIGMIGLKVKDVTGPYKKYEYIGGISQAGILNVNQGMVRLDLLKDVGYFDESYPDYGMDVDLTTKILLKGYKIVYTKKVAILHFRNYIEYPGAYKKNTRNSKLLLSQKIYVKKFHELCRVYRIKRLLFFRFLVLIRLIFLRFWEYLFFPFTFIISRTRYAWIIGNLRKTWLLILKRVFSNSRDWNNILRGQYLPFFDLWYNRKKSYYLVQKINKNRI